MTKVVVQNGNIDSALRKFKVKVARSGVPSEIKKRKCYDKPGVKRRKAKEEMIRNSRKRRRNDR
jgi:small subunit ribosomal protein S21